MIRRITLAALAVAVILLFVGVEYWSLTQRWGWVRDFRHSNAELLGSTSLHWFWVSCLSVYFSWFIYLRSRRHRSGAIFFLCLFVAWAAGRYVLGSTHFSVASDCVVLLAAITLAQGFALLCACFQKDESLCAAGMICCLILVLLAAPFFSISTAHPFGYRGHIRWNGPWNTPNTFGLLMGTAALLSAGLVLFLNLKKEENKETGAIGCRAAQIVLVLASVTASICLLKSYSRGAWLGSLLAVVYLGCHWWRIRRAEIRSQSVYSDLAAWNGAPRVISKTVIVPAMRASRSANLVVSAANKTTSVKAVERTGHTNPAFLFFQYIISFAGHSKNLNFRRLAEHANNAPEPWVRWLMRNVLGVSVLLIALGIIGFWSLKEIEHPLAQRIASATNKNDFSWRNRVVAYEGALQIIAGKPLLGCGWSRPPALFENLYKPSHLEGTAILLNDYLSLAMTLGLPALFCFAGYVGLSFGSLAKSAVGKHSQWLKHTCRAGAIVLLTGFWFDRGLFDLPTSLPFWILLELGKE